jgi:hypothetical protein
MMAAPVETASIFFRSVEWDPDALRGPADPDGRREIPPLAPGRFAGGCAPMWREIFPQKR